MMLGAPGKAKGLMAILGLLIGIVLLIPELTIWIKSCCRRPQETTEPIQQL